jgi:phosphopantothenoylcysteine decarboxylase/phosphopantothenate--cysteine ligase
VVTAGGTREALDPVRYLTNRSSGKQGHALAQAALDAGAEVILISAAHGLSAPVGAKFIAVESAERMLKAVQANIASADALIMAAAVADFRPQSVAQQKIKKSPDGGGTLILTLERTPDILLEVKKQRKESRRPRVVVGFAAESEHLLANAKDKLERKQLDLLIANDITQSDAGFDTDTNRVIMIDAQGNQQPIDLASKAKISEQIILRVASLIGRAPKGATGTLPKVEL